MDDIFFAVISSPEAAKKAPAKIAENRIIAIGSSMH